MRTAKQIFAGVIQLLLVFVMSAGPLPLGIPRAEAAPPPAPPADVVGSVQLTHPKLLIVFDTSKSMNFFPGDPNGDTSFKGQDWDPTIPTAPAQCQNKFCVGKKTLYDLLPNYSDLIDMGLAGYNQYYEIANHTVNYTTTCTYDQIAYQAGNFGNYFFNSDQDLTGNPATGAGSPAFVCTPTNATGPHQCKKWSLNPNGNTITSSELVTPPYGPAPGGTDTLVNPIDGLPYTWFQTTNATLNFDKAALGGVCPATLPNYAGGQGGCTAANPCDLTFINAFIQPFPNITTGVFQGPSFTNAGNVYTLIANQPVTRTFWDACTVPTASYTGTGANCDSVGPCALTQITGATPSWNGSQVTANNNVYNPGAGWSLFGAPGTSSLTVPLTTRGQVCPGAVGTVIDQNSAPPWNGYATSGNGCNGSPTGLCQWTLTQDFYDTGENYGHSCIFTRSTYVWRQYLNRCQFSTPQWTYDTTNGTPYCGYKEETASFGRPTYTYSWSPVDGELLGQTNLTFAGNNDATGVPTAVSYSNGSFSNGDCPNLIYNDSTKPACFGGQLCKLAWATNTTIGATSYPQGRYSNASITPPGNLILAADPLGTLTSPLFPPTPLGYSGDWLSGSGAPQPPDVTLYANFYAPPQTNPPASQVCTAGCSFNYAYVYPPPGNPNSVATTMPSNRTSGWSQLPDTTPALSWVGIAPSQAFKGATPAADSPILKALSKFDPVSNPTGFQLPQKGDYTPLTGTLLNAKDYLQTQIDADPYAGCRKYYVMLLTDGEEQPANLGNDPVAAVTALRNMTTSTGVPVDVQTFVIGFGITSPVLNAMARAGGHAVKTDQSAEDSGPNAVALDANPSASDPNPEGKLLARLTAAFGKIIAGRFTRSKPTLNAAGTRLYSGYFEIQPNGLEWQGHLDAVDESSLQNNTINQVPSGGPVWQYDQILNGLAPGSRTVWTSLGSGLIPFTDPSVLPAIDGADLANADATVKFLINDSQNELYLNTTTPKASRASDIFHSLPAIVDAPTQSSTWAGPNVGDLAGYQAFHDGSAKSRATTIYIGANDGMLHAVHEDLAAAPPVAGRERWAYVPETILPSLPTMRSGHSFGVDGSVGVADVCFGTCSNAANWLTILVGSLRQGGTGVYALDVTDPLNPTFLWEHANPTISTGETWSAPTIARVNLDGVLRWAVVMGGGVGAGVGNKLLILDAQTGLVMKDSANAPAQFPISDDPGDPAPNGVAARPTLYRPNDSALIQRIFFNDTEGKIWRTDASNPALGTWTPTKLFDPLDATLACTQNVFGTNQILSSEDGTVVGALPLTGPKRPQIFNRPSLALDSLGKLIVFAGTGDTTNPNSIGDFNYVYAINDYDPGDPLSGTCGKPVFVIQFPLNMKVLSDFAFSNGTIFVATYAPPNAPNVCSDKGNAFLYSFDSRTGAPKNVFANNTSHIIPLGNIGIPSSPVVSGNYIYLNASASPDKYTKQQIGNTNDTFRVQGWQRVQ